MKGFFLEPECRDVDGLGILVLPDNSFPVVAVYSLAYIGSANETDPEAGISHFVEHLLFKGTPQRPVGRIGYEIMRAGGEVNGFTTHDYTGYTIAIESSRLDLALDIHGDAMAHSAFDPAEIEKERTVILEEVKLGETSPGMILRKKIFRRIYPDHSYGRPVIGSRKTVGNASREMLVGYYRKNYCRENMAVVVVGDVKTENVVAGIEKYFSAVPHGESAPSPGEPAPGPGDSFVERRNVNDTYVRMAMSGVGLSHPDYPALSVLGIVLGEGQCGRLFRRVQYPGIANSIGFHTSPMKNAGLMVLSATCQLSRAVELEDVVAGEFENLRKEPPNNAELDRAKKTITAYSVYDRDTFSERAVYQSHFAALASPDFDRAYLEAIEEMTRERLLEAAQKYFNLESAITGKITPKKTLKKIESPDAGSLPGDWSVTRPTLKTSAAPGWDTDGKVKRIVLENGAVILYQENRQLPLIACNAFFRAGSSLEDTSSNGLASLTQRLFLKGAAGRSIDETSALLESLGIDMGGYTRPDDACLCFETLPEELDTALVLLRDAVSSPNLDGTEMERIRKDMIAQVRHEQDDMFSYIARTGTKALWGKHPYACPPSGREETLTQITLQDVRDFHDRFYRPDRLVVSIVGDLDPEEASAKASSVFGKMTGTGSKDDHLSKYVPIDTPMILNEKKSWPAAIVSLSWRCASLLDEDCIPLRVLSAVLGNPFGSRIWTAIREERGLAYSTGAGYSPGILGGAFSLYAGVNARKIPLVRELLIKELELIRTSPADEKELNDAKMFLTGAHKLHHQSAPQMANHLGFYEICGLGYEFDAEYVDRVTAVTIEDLMRVAKDHLHPDNFLTMIVSPKTPWDTLCNFLRIR